MSEPIKHTINVIDPHADFSDPMLIITGNENITSIATCFRCGASVLIVRDRIDMRPVHLQWHRHRNEQLASRDMQIMHLRRGTEP